MSIGILVRLIGALLVAHVAVGWVRFSSDTFPYTIKQPSSFRYVPLLDGPRGKRDYFSPSLGSMVTNVSITADPGTRVPNPIAFLRGQGGRRIHRSTALVIDGRRRTLMCADFSSFGVSWTVEQASFVANGLVWHLSASYDPKYKQLRPLMLKMLSTFRLRVSSKRHRPAIL